MKKVEEIKAMIAAARTWDELEKADEAVEEVFFAGIISYEEYATLLRLSYKREQVIYRAIQTAAIATTAAEKVFGGVAADYEKIHDAAYDQALMIED